MDITIKEFKKSVKIYKSHKIKNGFISVTFADVYYKKNFPVSVSIEKTKIIPKNGGALQSLYNYYYG